MMNYRKTLSTIVLGMAMFASAFAQGKLIFAIDVVRHGDRTPLIVSSNMTEVLPFGPGQLTGLGMRQEYDLGKTLRQQYVEREHLLPNHYDASSMNVRSSGYARTMMSAQSLLLGLYPLGTGPMVNETTSALPEGFQPIPIYTVPVDQDSLLVPDYDKARFQQLLETHVVHSPQWVQKDKELKGSYSKWSQMAGISIRNLAELIPFSDRLMIERSYHVPLPDGLSEQEAERIIKAGQWALLEIENNLNLSLACGHDLAQRIKQELNLAIAPNRSLKYLLFTAHDTTIAAQLRLLGHTLDENPPYASQLNYALYDMGASHYEVRVTLNQKPVFVERCGGFICDLDTFISIADDQS